MKPYYLPVMPKQCETCPFRTDSSVPDIQAKVIKRVLSEANQICHGTEGPNRQPRHFCRGARDVQLRFFHVLGLLPEPTDAAWEAALEQYCR